jgi:hypothetical protein
MVDILTLSILGLSVLGLAFGAFAWKNRKSGDHAEINYRAFFVLGITFLPVGVTLSASTDNPGFLGMSVLGAAYLAIGLANRDKWKQ